MKVNRRIRRGPDPTAHPARRRSTPCARRGYGPELLRERLSVRFPDDVGLLNRAPALERLRDGRAASDVALRLCFLEAAEPAAAVHRLFGAARTRDLVAARVLRRRGTAAARRACASTCTASWRCSRTAASRATDLGAFGLPRGDMVYPPGSDSVLLAEAVPAARAASACSTSAPAAASRRCSVAARADVGRRGRHRRARGGDGAHQRACSTSVATSRCAAATSTAPVRGERFDLIIANPPFVPAPHARAGLSLRRAARRPRAAPGGARAGRRICVPAGGPWRSRTWRVRRGETVADILAAVAARLRRPGARPGARDRHAGRPGGGAGAVRARRRLRRLCGARCATGSAYLERHRVEQVVLLLLAAERGGAAGLEVTEAFQRTLPLPLSQPPPALVAQWLARMRACSGGLSPAPLGDQAAMAG